jgi:hypothetical protein
MNVMYRVFHLQPDILRKIHLRLNQIHVTKRLHPKFNDYEDNESEVQSMRAVVQSLITKYLLKLRDIRRSYNVNICT